MDSLPDYPPKSLDPFYLYFTYCNQNIKLYNQVAQKYNVIKLPYSFVLARSYNQNRPQGWN